jgi:hypothetical protein
MRHVLRGQAPHVLDRLAGIGLAVVFDQRDRAPLAVDHQAACGVGLLDPVPHRGPLRDRAAACHRPGL